MARKGFTRLPVVILVLAILGGAGALIREVVRAVRLASEAEVNLHLVICVCRSTEELIEREGTWPASWDALFADPGLSECALKRFGISRSDLQARVSLRFDVSLEDVARESDAGDLIRPVGICYPSYRSKVLLVIEAARRRIAVH